MAGKMHVFPLAISLKFKLCPVLEPPGKKIRIETNLAVETGPARNHFGRRSGLFELLNWFVDGAQARQNQFQRNSRVQQERTIPASAAESRSDKKTLARRKGSKSIKLIMPNGKSSCLPSRPVYVYGLDACNMLHSGKLTAPPTLAIKCRSVSFFITGCCFQSGNHFPLSLRNSTMGWSKPGNNLSSTSRITNNVEASFPPHLVQTLPLSSLPADDQ